LKEFTNNEMSANTDEEADKLIQKYMQANKVNFGTAQIAISKARPELFAD